MINKRSLLIADRKTNLCRILEVRLKKAGYSVICVHDGKSALEQFKLSNFDAVVVDIEMPGMHGVSELRDMRKLKKEIPIIVLTACDNNDLISKALALGITACVNKPFDLDNLVALVMSTVNERGITAPVSLSESSYIDLFREGQPITLELCDQEYAGEYQCRIEENNAETLVLTCPCGDTKYLNLKVGTQVCIGFIGDSAFYEFETVVLANRDSYLPTIIIGKPSVVRRVQRRKHPRIKARVPLDIRLSGVDKLDERLESVLKVYTENISAGGFKIITREELPHDARIMINAHDTSGSPIFSGLGQIVHTRRLFLNHQTDWEYGIRLIGSGDASDFLSDRLLNPAH